MLKDWEKPEYIPDPDAEKPEDWDDETDGEWEPPSIPNPEYKVICDVDHSVSNCLHLIGSMETTSNR